MRTEPRLPWLFISVIGTNGILKEHELGVRLEEAPEGSGPYVPNAEK